MAKNILVSPVVKWVGGKRQIMSSIVELMPKNMKGYQYIEPFIGGGAVLFHLQPAKAIINDFNAELTNLYETIRSSPEELIKDLKKHKNTPEYFYQLRSLDREPGYNKLTAVKKASRVIYLNKTCFNGLYRVNNSGEFNAPFGKYKNPNIVNEPTIRAVSNYLRSNEITIMNGDFESVLNKASKKSFIYLDPPYHPLSKSSNFTGYVQGGWGEEEQIRLRETCDTLNKKGIKFLLSNSAAKFITDQYKHYDIKFIKANRAINSDGSKRGEIDEVLIRNYG
jgi:DNA adenine methylase